MYNDNRKLRLRNLDGSYSIIYVDEFVDDLLKKEFYFDTTLPVILSREILEEKGRLKQRVSFLELELE